MDLLYCCCQSPKHRATIISTSPFSLAALCCLLGIVFNYGIIALAGGIGVVWKVVKGTRFQQSKETDLVSGCEFFDALPEHYCNERETDEAGTGTLRGRVMAKLF